MSTLPTGFVPNPLTWLTDFIGSANVQKVLAGIQVGVAGLTGTEGKSLGVKVAGMSIGAAYGIAVHWIDAVRARIDAEKESSLTHTLVHAATPVVAIPTTEVTK